MQERLHTHTMNRSVLTTIQASDLLPASGWAWFIYPSPTRGGRAIEITYDMTRHKRTMQSGLDLFSVLPGYSPFGFPMQVLHVGVGTPTWSILGQHDNIREYYLYTSGISTPGGRILTGVTSSVTSLETFSPLDV